jgi:hypothetical protein
LITTEGKIGQWDATREAKEPPVDQQSIQNAAPKRGEATCPSPKHATPPSSCTMSSIASEESEDSYYIPDNYYLDESRYDSNMFKKNWEALVENSVRHAQLKNDWLPYATPD